jgi:hypothetical protein
MQAPDFILTCLGRLESFGEAERVATEAGGGVFQLDQEFSLLARDERMPAAFEASYDRSQETMSKKDWAAVRGHRTVAYFIARKVPDGKRLSTMLQALTLVDALLEARLATAVKCDSSGIAHGVKEWSRLARAALDASTEIKQRICYQAWVRKPLADGAMLYTCGMHLFGKPDFVSFESNERKALKSFERAFRTAQLGEQTKPPLVLEPKKKLEVYPQGHPYFNKYGYLEIVNG